MAIYEGLSMSDRSHSTLDLSSTAPPLLWIGRVLGISFLAAPAKFQRTDVPTGTAPAATI